jgi:tetratricopeptide (TPR) repeat protein
MDELQCPKIALAMIVKDDSELEDLHRCLNSVVGRADHVFLTVTGTETGKIEGLASPTVTVDRFPWISDFSAARNHNWSQVPIEFDFILWLDADDVLTGKGDLHALAGSGPDWFHFRYDYAQDENGRPVSTHWKPRLIRNDGKSRWEKPVHENLVHDGPYTEEMSDLFTVRHDWKPENHYAKERRNNIILLKEYERDGKDTDPRTLHYLGKSFLGLGCAPETPEDARRECLDNALYFFTEHTRTSGWDEETYFSYVGSGRALVLLDRAQDAENAFAKAVLTVPQWADAYWYLCKLAFTRDEFAKAIEFGETALTKQVPKTVLSIDSTLYDFDGPSFLALAYLSQTRTREALALATAIDTGTERSKELLDIVSKGNDHEKMVRAFLDALDLTGRLSPQDAGTLATAIPDYALADERLQEAVFPYLTRKNWPAASMTIYCGPGSGTWGPWSAEDGLGGSEEAVVCLSREMARLGFKVTVYNDCGDLKGTYDGVDYLPYWRFNPQDGFDWLVLWRNPGAALSVPGARKVWIWNHDAITDEAFPEGSVERAERVVFLSRWARSLCPKVPDAKVFISNNGILPEQFENLPPKDDHTLVYASSYDRGLECLLRDVMPRILTLDPEAVLHVAYGWDTFLRFYGNDPKRMTWKREMDHLLSRPYIVHHGRLGHLELAQLFGRCRVWAYPTEFGETNCITLQKAQAAGCWPVVTKVGAIPERLLFGNGIDAQDIYDHPDTQDEFARTAAAALLHPALTMTQSRAARSVFSWTETARTWKEAYAS